MAQKPISRRNFLRGVAVSTVGMATLGLVACDNSADQAEATPAAATPASSDAPRSYAPGTYYASAAGMAAVAATVTFSETSITDVILDLSGETPSIGQVAGDELVSQIISAQGIDIDGVSGATITTDAVKKCINSCMQQALGEIPVISAADISARQDDAPGWTKLNPQDESYDTYTTDFAALFSPIAVGHMQLKNRIAKSAAGSDTMLRGQPVMPQNAVDYHGRMADGGAALIICEEGCVSAFGMSPFSSAVVEKEIAMAETKKLVDRVHEGGAYIGAQFGIGSPLDPGDVNAYTTEELQDIIRRYGECALMLKEAGFDCVELKGATTDGLNQFVTRRINQREDEYGASTEEDRVRFFSELVAEVRRTCGSDFAILTLINAVEENDVGLGDSDGFIVIEESQNLAKALVNVGADLVQLRVATGGMEANCWATDTNFCTYKANGSTGYGNQFDFAYHFGGLYEGAYSGLGAFIPMSHAVKQAVDVPVGCASYMDPRTAPDLINNAIVDGKVDVVFMNRPLTVDPELPNKLKDGRQDEVAPCTRCFHCHNKAPSALENDNEKCRVNATTQYAYMDEFPEGYELTPAAAAKKVMVIGGGVAGMEAARIAAERGHSVTLYEKDKQLGGLLSYAEAIKGSHERPGDLCAYLVRQQELKGVNVVMGTEVTLDTIKGESPDAVIVAVGGGRESKFSGGNVVSMDAFPTAQIGDNVVILGANAQAVDIAQYLIAQGKRVQLVHEKTAAEVDLEQSPWIRDYTRAHLYAHGAKAWNESTVKNVSAESVTIVMKSGLERALPCDTVIECYDMTPNTALLEQIQAAGFDAYAAGCDAPSNFQTAIHAGYKAGRYLN